MAVQSGEISRVSDLSDEPVDRLLVPIQGYEDQPLLPLYETIKPISKLFNRIDEYVFIALNNCQNPTDGLDQQESASIHLYTMQFSGGPSLYKLLNQSLRDENREELKPWFLFLKLFLTALYKLPSQCKTVWRGIKNVDLSSEYKRGTKFAWWGVSSCNMNIEILESNAFLGKTGERTIFSIECFNGKSVINHSYFKKKEDEVILIPGSYFEVIGHLNPAPQLHIIQLRQITPPITFLEPPFPQSTNNNSSSDNNQSNTNSSSTSNIIKQDESSNTNFSSTSNIIKQDESSNTNFSSTSNIIKQDESSNTNSSSTSNIIKQDESSNTNSSSTSNIIKQDESSNVISQQIINKSSSMIYFHFFKYLVYSLI